MSRTVLLEDWSVGQALQQGIFHLRTSSDDGGTRADTEGASSVGTQTEEKQRSHHIQSALPSRHPSSHAGQN